MTAIPTIHLNGSHAATLIEQNTEVSASLLNLANKMREAYPNARDFYVQGPDAYNKARAEHESRIAAVMSLRQDYIEIIHGIQEQIQTHGEEPTVRYRRIAR